jgi:hypothetical protein
MRVVAAVTEDDMVAAFLRAELDSPRFSPSLRAALADAGLDPSIVRRPDTGDPAANAARRRVLAAYRGYRTARSSPTCPPARSGCGSRSPAPSCSASATSTGTTGWR